MPDPITRYQPIDPSLFIHNRHKLAEALLPNSLVILPMSPSTSSYQDSWLPSADNHDFFYLTGIEQPATIFLLYPDAPNQSHRELLFIKHPEPKDITWEGDFYSLEGASAVTGIQNVHWLAGFPHFLQTLMKDAEHVYLHSPENKIPTIKEATNSNVGFIKWLQAHYPLHQYRRLAPIMRRLRSIKSATEVALIKKACEITSQGWQEMIPHVRPRVMEYELEASLGSSFLKRGSRGFAYPPIIASGPNTNVLHYTANNRPCQEGELLLIDVGAEYAGYKADMTRTIPVSGRFTKRQQEVYNSVLRVMEAAKELLRPGILLQEYERQVGLAMTEQLCQLGLLTSAARADSKAQASAYKRYFMHATSHHLGLDVHDTADTNQSIAAGMVLTIEPGIYIPEEKIGIRLENDIHIVKNGVEELIEGIPLHPEAVEAMMQKRRS